LSSICANLIQKSEPPGPRGAACLPLMTLLLGVALHIVLHRQWIKAASRGFFKPEAGRLRRNAILVVWLSFAFLLSILAELVGVAELHILAGLAMTVGVATHLALHWKWIVSSARRQVGLGSVRAR